MSRCPACTSLNLLEVTRPGDDFHWWLCASCNERTQGEPIARAQGEQP